MEVVKVIKNGDFFFFCFPFLKTTEICFGSTKMGIFYREKAFHARKNIRKNDFAPSEKYACYAPDSSKEMHYSKIKASPLTNLHLGQLHTLDDTWMQLYMQ